MRIVGSELKELLGLLAFRHVHGYAEKPAMPGLWVNEIAPATCNPAHRLIGEQNAVFDLVTALRVDGAADGLFPQCSIFRVDPIAPDRGGDLCLRLKLEELPRLAG